MPLLAPPPPPPLPLSSHHLRLPFLSFPPSAGWPIRRGDLVIRMGGGPRTFPGGVSKWQWKRMQARKAKQLLKARLARERQLYEMRKRAELRDAVTHLERPWDPDSASTAALAPNLLSVAADDQLKGLADRFHRPGGVDLWNDRDGPQVFATPDTGRASARFFPLNAVHSVQPYARLGAGVEGTQGVRENVAVENAYGDDEPTVEFMENDGLWEPVSALDGGDDNNFSEQSWKNDDGTPDSEETKDVFAHGQRALVKRDGRRSDVPRREAANSMSAGSDESSYWRGHGFLSDSKGAREGHLEQRWSNSNGNRRNPPTATGRWKPSNTEGSNAIGKDHMAVGSFSDSEVNRRGFEPKWRSRKREDTKNATGNWKLSYDSHGNVIRKVRINGEFNPNSQYSGRDGKLEPKWKAPSRFNQSENRSGRPGLKYRPNANYGERPGGHMRGNNGDGGDRFGNASISDLEEPTWKPRRKNGARNNNGRRDYNDNMSGRFRRGGDGAARHLDAHPTAKTDREDGECSDDGRRQRMDRNGARQFRGDGYALRPTSELHGSMDRNEGRQFRGDGYSPRRASELRDSGREREFR